MIATIQRSGLVVADLINLAGIALFMTAIYYYILQENAQTQATKLQARKRSILFGLLFGFYAIIIGTMGYDGTWIGELGFMIERQIQNFTHQLITIGEQPEPTNDLVANVVYITKILGLIAYVIIATVATFATTALLNAIRSIVP